MARSRLGPFERCSELVELLRSHPDGRQRKDRPFLLCNVSPDRRHQLVEQIAAVPIPDRTPVDLHQQPGHLSVLGDTP
jgi:hypothetical protein